MIIDKIVFVLRGLYLHGIVLLWALLVASVDSLYDKGILGPCIGVLIGITYITQFFLLIEEIEVYASWRLIRAILSIDGRNMINRVSTVVLKIRANVYANSSFSDILTVSEKILLTLYLIRRLKPGESPSYRSIEVEIGEFLRPKIGDVLTDGIPLTSIVELFLPELEFLIQSKRDCAKPFSERQRYQTLRETFKELLNYDMSYTN